MTRHAKIAIVLVVLSCLFWAGLLLLPFLELSVPGKAKLGTALIVCGEVAFWAGALIVGPDLMKRYCRYLHPKHWRFRPQRRESAGDPAPDFALENARPEPAPTAHPLGPPDKTGSPPQPPGLSE